MNIIIISIHIAVAIILVLTVLLQAGKGSGMGAAFGGSSGTVFGTRGPATLISKATAIAAIVFMCTSLSLGLSQSGGVKKTSVMDDYLVSTPKQEQTTPQTEAPIPSDPILESTEENAQMNTNELELTASAPDENSEAASNEATIATDDEIAPPASGSVDIESSENTEAPIEDVLEEGNNSSVQ